MKKILIVDDSALMRRVISDIINADKHLETDTYAINGLEALEILESGRQFDAIVLDINMPKMNGIEFLKELNKRGMKQQVIIVSTLAKEGARETIQALELGAFDFITKPDQLSEMKGVSFNQKLIRMLYGACGLEDETEEPADEMEKSGWLRRKKITEPEKKKGTVPGRQRSSDRSRPVGKNAKKLVAVACSTGGPKALQYVIPFLPENLDAPVLLVQHMPAGFTESLSKRLDELSRVHVKEAADGEELQKGTVYIAKGGSQMRLVERSRGTYCLKLTDEPPRNGLRPCADIMFESLMKTGFDEITCVVMTGMGADGTKGILQLQKTNKIYVIAQDEKSCVVYGMPKAIAKAGAVDEVQSLRNIADAVTKHVGVR